LKKYKKGRHRRTEIADHLKSQLDAIKDELASLRKTMRDHLACRKRQHDKFNVSLFGRTMADALRAELAKRKLRAGKAEFVFDQSLWMVRDSHNRWLSKLCNKAGVRQFGFHGIRHLSASIGMETGANILDIQQLLRHTSTRTTERYIHRTTRNNRAVSALDKAMRTPSSEHGLWDKAEDES
jgi:integrase